MSRHQRPLTYVIGLGITLAIGIAIRLVTQQDVRSTRSHDANGGDFNDANSTGSSDNNRQKSNARFVFSSFVNLADLGRNGQTWLLKRTDQFIDTIHVG